MKALKSLIIVGALCGALSLPALGEIVSKPMTTSEGKPVQLAYNQYGKHCWWHNGHKHCRYYKHHRYYHCRYKQCWRDYYNRVHCRCVR